VNNPQAITPLNFYNRLHFLNAQVWRASQTRKRFWLCGNWGEVSSPPTTLKARCSRQQDSRRIDTDSQAHATLVTTGTKDYGVDNSLYTVLMADRQNAAQTLLNCIVQSTWDADLHVLPASPMLEGAERELMGVAGAPYRLADPLSRIANRYAAIIIDTRPSFSLMTEMGLITATDAIVPVEPRYLETVGLMSVLGKINDIREGWRQPNLRVSGILVTKMDTRVRGHNHLLNEQCHRRTKLSALMLC
jgi:cellulose biosynthesis protein BcsQ